MKELHLTGIAFSKWCSTSVLYKTCFDDICSYINLANVWWTLQYLAIVEWLAKQQVHLQSNRLYKTRRNSIRYRRYPFLHVRPWQEWHAIIPAHLYTSTHTLENVGVCYFKYLNHQFFEKIKHLAKFLFYRSRFSKKTITLYTTAVKN